MNQLINDCPFYKYHRIVRSIDFIVLVNELPPRFKKERETGCLIKNSEYWNDLFTFASFPWAPPQC